MFDDALSRLPAAAWDRLLETTLPTIHPVDRDATRIWWSFYPLALASALADAEEPEAVARTLRLEGRYRLEDQIDDSHWFLYGHRYWREVKTAIRAWVESGPVGEDAGGTGSFDFEALVRELITAISAQVRADPALVRGIAIVGLMTLRQVGVPRFSRDLPPVASLLVDRTPDQTVAARQRNDSQGVFGFFRGSGRSQFSVWFDERRADGRFPIIARQHLTTAAAADGRDYATGSRPSLEGPIPVQCRSGTCGTCWVGVIGGADKLSPVDAHEARRMRDFGYIVPEEQTQPVIRLACMAQASGNITIVIPPWNGVFGKKKLGV